MRLWLLERKELLPRPKFVHGVVSYIKYLGNRLGRLKVLQGVEKCNDKDIYCQECKFECEQVVI